VKHVALLTSMQLTKLAAEHVIERDKLALGKYSATPKYTIVAGRLDCVEITIEWEDQPEEPK
jgi:hypothetical protein